MILTMEQWIKLNLQTNGKDKLARLLQYLSKFLSHYIEHRKNARDWFLRLRVLENTLSMFRKLLRFGKSMEVLYGTLKTLQISDPAVRVLTTLNRIYQSLFLFLDHFIWLAKAGFIDLNKEKLINYSSRFWAGAILISLFRDFFEIKRILCKQPPVFNQFQCSYQHLPIIKKICTNVPSSRPFFHFVEEHQDIFWDTLKNSFDLWIPLTTLGKTNLSPGMVGMCGVVSSIIGLIIALNPTYKLSPA